MADTLTVELGERSYPIHFGANLTSSVATRVATLQADDRRCVVVTDRAVERAQSVILRQMFQDAPLFALEPGEETKSLDGLARVLDFLAAEKVDRRGVVFAVGGGVIGDLAGFAAATWLRGIDFIQVPTTLLAMVDSSVGGKTGINISAGKNLVGAFHQPREVFISTGMLGTLPAREFSAGMAEVIKTGLLGDVGLFESLEARPLAVDSPELAGVIRSCCRLKAAVVQADERETAKSGGRALLNLGHTFAHAIENVAGYGEYLHGEAVGIGLAAASRLSQKLGYIDAAAVARVEAVIARHALPTRLREPLDYAALQAAMTRDKKVRAGSLRFVVLTRLGTAAVHERVEPIRIEETFREVGAG